MQKENAEHNDKKAVYVRSGCAGPAWRTGSSSTERMGGRPPVFSDDDGAVDKYVPVKKLNGIQPDSQDSQDQPPLSLLCRGEPRDEGRHAGQNACPRCELDLGEVLEIHNIEKVPLDFQGNK